MQNIIVKTKYGLIKGVKEKESYVFKGVPYAKPPVGELRFKAPEKPDNFNGVYDATEFKNRSAQSESGNPHDFYTKEFYMDKVYKTPISEDSLYLNIWTPLEKSSEKYPVFFYIHGGAFMGGTGHEIEFRTDAYAKEGIILVTINYRVGALGFLAHKWLEDDMKSIGNFGILDQMEALDWVKENIESFGGDPNNITICGQSAGAMSVETLLCSRMADGKYNKAIIQSAGGYPQVLANGITLEEAYLIGERVVNHLNVESLEELKKVSMEEILEAQKQVTKEAIESGKGIPFVPVINGNVLTEKIDESVENGHANKVPMIIGSTKLDITVTKEEAESENSKFHKSCIDWSLMNEKVNDNPCYVYYFKRDLPGDDNGAFHSSELWYMFGTLGECWRPMEEEDYNLSREMLSYWGNFIKSGDPNSKGLSRWEKCIKNNEFVKRF